jgi:hypothetical protein
VKHENTIGGYIDILQFKKKLINNAIAIHLKLAHIQAFFVIIVNNWQTL